jgi:RNA polymerase sigma-70 factor (ECF subfamily)
VRGDDRAEGEWAAWLVRHGPALVLFARQWTPTRSDAEDVVQEAFVRFWRAKDRAQDAMAYLYACVETCAIDANRSDRRRVRREGVSARHENDAMFACRAECDERRALIESALSRLPDVQREVVVMKIWGGLSFPQIGSALGIPHDTAASRYRYAISRLRTELAEEPSHG